LEDVAEEMVGDDELSDTGGGPRGAVVSNLGVSSITVVEFLRELFRLFGSDDVFVVGVVAALLVCVVVVASRDVLEIELSDVDDVLAYVVVSMYFGVCRFFSSVFCNTSSFSCKSFTSILDSFSFNFKK
jgi:hypothetical protein